MRRGQKAALGAAAIVIAGIVAGVVITLPPRHEAAMVLTGAVLRQDSDPRRQMPIENAEVRTSDSATEECRSDSSGFFHLIVEGRTKRGEAITLEFSHAGYQPLEMAAAATNRIYIARLTPISGEAHSQEHGPEVAITNVRLRYSIKMAAMVSVGSVAKTLEVENTGDVACNGRAPCSPDGAWKAASGSASLDAGEGNEFREVRASCIAGPCPFTKIDWESENGGRTLKASALDWSDTATFLIEAEVTRSTTSDMIRQSYPVIFGNALNFTLPAGAEGPSLEAELNGADIVFPLGPDAIVSWAACTVKADADRSRLYRCELKPGYRLQ